MNEKFTIPGLISKPSQSVTAQRYELEEELASYEKAMKYREMKLKEESELLKIKLNKAMIPKLGNSSTTVNTPYGTAKIPYGNMPPSSSATQPNPMSFPEIMEYVKKYSSYQATPRTTALEELMNELFDTTEKEQFLIDLGYEFYTGSSGKDEFKRGDKVWNKAAHLEDVFVREAKIKLKNLLLTKQTLKFKF